MATYSNNTTIKVGTPVTAFRSSTSGSNNGTFSYTVPSGSYAVVTLAVAGGSAPFGGSFTAIARATISGNNFNLNINAITGPGSDKVTFPSGTSFYFEATSSVATSASYSFVALLFTNTP
jgi:hypothetical protein